MALIRISYDEWFPYYDIEKLEDYLDAGDMDRVIEVSEDDYAVYKGLLVQMERLQDKLEKLYKKGNKL